LFSRIPYLLKYFKKSIVASYNADNLKVWHKSAGFLDDPKFMAAYRQSMVARTGGDGVKDIHIEWRIHVICWAAAHAKLLPGDFAECGVSTGICTTAACHYIDFNATGKKFFLFDTFQGIPLEQISAAEKKLDRVHQNQLFYTENCFEIAKRNFAPFPNVVLVPGRVPETLTTHPIDRVCYLHLDMNIAAPEIAAIRFFWDKLSPGAPVVLDDYGWLSYAPQKEAMDAFAAEKGVAILTLPTGQGLLLKPA